ncbi:zinc transporter ZntB [Hyphococcus luteus]|uniref:Zinc transporter ZntB n=1 Tax=Hyphococcus luteus TaxID=2058213 RepID=A0A2S7K2J6_9PROT|nr:zinc transporter ZntB [Marinicaulis flavus]PQA86724.1 zinc transporter ZntB [Marinicaulis flavus]
MSDEPAQINRGETDTGPPFVFGFGFKGGVATETRWEDAASHGSDYDFIWLHLNMLNAEARKWIRSRPDIPFAAASALLADETRPRMTAFEKGLVVNLRGVNLNEGAEPEDMVSIRIWLSEKVLVTTRRRRLKAAQDLRVDINGGLRIDNTGMLLARIAAKLTDRAEPYVMEVEDQVDELEAEILEGGGSGLRAKLADARQAAVHFRRFIAPQRDALNRLAADESSLFEHHSKIELREVADRVTRMTEDIDAARERAMVLQDQLTDQRAEEMNRNMMVLSVVAAVFLPLGFLTGLFGINVGGMPWVESAAGFWIVSLISVFIAAGLLVIFRLIKWL